MNVGRRSRGLETQQTWCCTNKKIKWLNRRTGLRSRDVCPPLKFGPACIHTVQTAGYHQSSGAALKFQTFQRFVTPVPGNGGQGDSVNVHKEMQPFPFCRFTVKTSLMTVMITSKHSNITNRQLPCWTTGELQALIGHWRALTSPSSPPPPPHTCIQHKHT